VLSTLVSAMESRRHEPEPPTGLLGGVGNRGPDLGSGGVPRRRWTVRPSTLQTLEDLVEETSYDDTDDDPTYEDR
jgi:hypothetical protein